MALEPVGKTVIQIGLDDTKVTDGLTKLNAKMKMADNTWKNSLSSFKQSDRSIEKLGTSLKGMTDKLKVQKTIVEAHEQKVAKLAEEYGNTHLKTIKATGELEKQRATMGNLSRAVGEVTDELEELKRAEKLNNSPWVKRQQELEKYGQKMKDIGSSMMGVGQNMTMGVTAPLLGFGALATKTAAEYDAAEAQFTQVFTGMEKEAKSSLDSIAKTTGLLPNSLRGAYTQMAAFAKTSGSDTKDALDLTSRATMAAADSAAFYDKSIEEVTESLQSYLKGNFANDAALGISSTETTRNAAANDLYGKSFKDLSESQKQLTLLKMVEDGNKLSGALGQASRESNTLGTQTSNLKTAFADFQNEVAKPLLPIAVDVIKQLGTAAKGAATWFNGLSDGSKKTVLAVAGIAAAAGPALIGIGAISKGIGTVMTGISAIPKVMGIAKTAIGGVTTAFKLLRLAFATNPFGMILLAVTALGTGLVWLYKHNEKFRNAVNNMGKQVSQVFGSIVGWAKGLGSKLGGYFGSAINAAKNLGGKIGGAFNDMKKGVSNTVTKLGSHISNSWNNTKKLGSTVFGAIKDRGVKNFEIMKSGISKATTLTANGLSKGWNGIKKANSVVAEAIRKTAVSKYEALKSGTVKMMSSAASGLSGKWSSIKKNTTDMATKIKNDVVDKYKGLYEGASKWVTKIGSFMTGIKSSLSKKAGELGKSVANGAIGGLNGMIKGINTISSKIMDKNLLKPIPELSTGTRRGAINYSTPAIVGDRGPGNGPKGFRNEIIHRRNGDMQLTPSRDTLVHLNKGDRVYNGKQTYSMLGGRVPRFSKGTNKDFFGAIGSGIKAGGTWIKDKAVDATKYIGKIAGDVMDYIENPGKLVDMVIGNLGNLFGGVGGITGDLAGAAFKKIKTSLIDKVKSWFDEVGGSGDGSSFTSFPITTPYSPNSRPPGYPYNANHYGVDFGTPQGHPINAPTSGTLSTVFDPHGGQVAILKMANGWQQFFMHMEKVRKAGGIKAGSYLGNTGGQAGLRNSGSWSTGPHLHYQVNQGSSSWNSGTVNPLDFLSKHGVKEKIGQGTGSGSWLNQIQQAAQKMKETLSASDKALIAKLIQTESGGNSGITQQIVDMNTGANRARGLLQYVPSTFATYAVSGHKNITNGFDQLLAFFNNRNWRSDLQAWNRRMSMGLTGWGPSGTRKFANGGFVKGETYIAGEEYEEAIIPLDPKRKNRANELLSLTAQKINGKLPKFASGTAKSGTAKTYTVKKGDTLWGISQAYKTTVSMLKKLNNLKSDLIFPKQVLKLNDTAAKLTTAIKSHATTVKKTATKPAAKKKPATTTSMTGVISKFADSLMKSGTIFKDLKTSKTDISTAKFLESKLKGLSSNNIKTITTSVADIKKKIVDIEKTNKANIKSNDTKIKSATTKNFDEQLKIQNLQAERKLNGKSGTITVKTRIPARDTTLIDRNIAKSTLNKASHEKDLKTLKANEEKLLKKNATLKTKKEKADNAKKLAENKKRIAAEKKQLDKEIANLKKYEAQRADALKLKYKTEQKYVKGRSTASIDKLINTAKNNIGKNNTSIKNLKSENALYAKQTAALKSLQNAQILKSDTLQKIAKARETLLKKMEDLKSKETAIKEEKQSFTDTLKDNLQQYAGFGSAKGHTARDFVSWMQYRLGKMRTFASNVQKLKGMGLDPTLIKEMLAGGIEAAMPKVAALVQGGSGYIGQINSIQKEINSVVNSMSKEQAGIAFDGELASNKKQQDSVNKQLTANTKQQKDFLSKQDKVIGIQSYVDLQNKTSKYKFTPTPAPKAPPKTAAKTTTKVVNKKHTLKRGEHLTDIAKKYGTTVAEIKKLNGKKADAMVAGTVLLVPTKVKVPAKQAATSTGTYKIKAGDSLGLIAQMFGTTVAKLKSDNKLKSDLIHPNQTLKVPKKAAAPKKTTTKATTTKKAATQKSSKVVSLEAAKKKREAESTKLIVNTAKKLNLVGKNDKYAAQLQKEIAEIRKTTTKKDDAALAKLEKEFKANRTATNEMVKLLSQILNKPTNVILDGKTVSKTVEKNIVTNAKTTARKTVAPTKAGGVK